MHYIIAFTYGLTVWMASVIYTFIAAPDMAALAIASGPVAISALMVFILAIDAALDLCVRLVVRLAKRVF